MPDFIVGLDLGQSADPTALAVLKRSLALDIGGLPVRNHRDDLVYQFACVHLERFALGTSYPAIVRRVGELLSSPRLQPEPRLAIDATGVGRAVVDLVLNRNITDDAHPITIVAGDTTRRDTWNNSHIVGYWVPRRKLVGSVQAALQSERLKVAPRLVLADTLKQELLNFQIKITPAAHKTFGVWREGAHDDLVLAVAMAIWLGERREIDFLPEQPDWNDRDSAALAAGEQAEAESRKREAEAIQRDEESKFEQLQLEWNRIDAPHWWGDR
jgi:hypothetical protein